MYRRLVKPILFQLPPEVAHHLAVSGMCNPLIRPFLGLNHRLRYRAAADLHTDLCGIPLEHPIGLAAGFDKGAVLFPHLRRLGFAFAEIGTITAHAQPGNPKPRLFRLPNDHGLINRMGFNNDGAENAAKRLAALPAPLPLGGNIGKSKSTPLEDAETDYRTSFQALQPYVDYFVVNVSSPNTPNLRQLQDREPLQALLTSLQALNEQPRKPLLLKIAPDLTDSQLDDIVTVAKATHIDGIIATNTTINRDGLYTAPSKVKAMGAGGLSGQPIRQRATDVVRTLRRKCPDRIQIIGVGGIFTGADVLEKITAGANCVQIYTGWVYRGPNTIYRMLAELKRAMKEAGFATLREAVGARV